MTKGMLVLYLQAGYTMTSDDGTQRISAMARKGKERREMGFCPKNDEGHDDMRDAMHLQ